jgi:ABC-type multidrug transport system permease subunit
MNHGESILSAPAPHPSYRLLEYVASGVLRAVLAAICWMIAVAYFPEWGRMVSVELEVIAIVALLVAALGLVSLVALLHTRK